MPKILQDVADVYYGKSQNGVSDQYGHFPIVGTGGFLGNARIPLFSGPAVVVGRKGTLNNPLFVPGDFWAVDTTYAVIPKENIHAKWLYFILCTSRLELLNEATGVPSINRDRLYRVPVQDIEYPGQTRIAYVLDTIDEAIAKTKSVIAKLKQVRAGMLHDLLSYGLDEHGRLRDPITHPGQFKDSPLGRIPKEWETEQIGLLFDLGRGRVINQQDMARCPGLYPVYSSQSANEGVFGYLGTYDFEGDYITWTTDGANAGTVFFRTGRFNCTNVCGTLKSRGRVRESFGALTFARESKKHVSYVGNPKLMNNTVSRIRIAFPERVDEQHAIIDALNDFDAGIEKELAEYRKLLSIKSGVQDDLLTGRVRVPKTIVEGAAVA